MRLLVCIIIAALSLTSCSNDPSTLAPAWPASGFEAKPWTRWWWPGNALTKEGITAELEAFSAAGLGGVEITPIYGVHRYEDQFIDYLSPEWMELLNHTLKEAERLGLGVDMATGTGWPFGGPWVGEQDACKTFVFKVYEVNSARINEKIEFIQQPFLRAVGNQVYEVHERAAEEGRAVRGTRKEPLTRLSPGDIDIRKLLQPVSRNKNLQALALDQVQFERSLPLVALMAFGGRGGQKIDLMEKVDAAGRVDWTAPEGKWKVYALFEGSHGKMVERAGPGGEGNVIDHFSGDALRHHLARFDSAFQGNSVGSLRAFFNDSYEVDDARGAADWTPALFKEFRQRRGYDLREFIPALVGHDSAHVNERVLHDYRETISELLLTNFTTQWANWSHEHAALVRNQAHGSPANILDLYSVVDIPEIEGVEPLRIKMATSAANVMGKRLVSSESATWLDEHFESNLSDIKAAVDRFLLNGVNHIFYHGTCYSPQQDPWPGWLFYAAVHLNPRNPLWKDFDALNLYITRCQSFLQSTRSDNDVLLYYPIADRFSAPGPEMVEHFDAIGDQFKDTAFRLAAEELLRQGYSFDFISDKQLENTRTENGRLITQGNASYQTLVIPQCNYMPLGTFKKIGSLVDGGAAVVFFKGLPSGPPGLDDLENRKRAFGQVAETLGQAASESETQGRRIFSGDSLPSLLSDAGTRRETISDLGLSFSRRKDSVGRTIYMMRSEKGFDAWVPLHTESGSVVVYDPMTGAFGKAETRFTADGRIEVALSLTAAQAVILQVYGSDISVSPFHRYKADGDASILAGRWRVSFISGGPVLPAEVETDSLKSWPALVSHGGEAFSGTAAYQLVFARPPGPGRDWLLDLGTLHETAEVFLNGDTIATLIGPVFQVRLKEGILKEQNELTILVSNLMANRIADMDRKGIFWKKFYNVNFPARKAENRVNGLFDASGWQPRPSGMLGPVRLWPLK